MPATAKVWAFRFALVGLSVAIGVAWIEFAFRIFVKELDWRNLVDPHLGWSSHEFQRFDPLAAGRPRATARILVLGDSVIAGSGVSSADERFPVVLQERLGDRARVEIFAAGGWGTDQQLLAFLRKGRPWKPDVVILAFTATNDLANILSSSHGEGSPKPYFVANGSGRLELFDGYGERREPPPVDVQSRRLRESFLLTFLRMRIHEYRESREDTRERVSRLERVDPRYRLWEPQSKDRFRELIELRLPLTWSPQESVSHVSAFIHEDFPLNAYQWSLLEGILDSLHEEVERIGGRLVVVPMPMPLPLGSGDLRFVTGSDFEFRFRTPAGAFTFRAAEPVDRLRRICARLGIELYDPTSAFLDAVDRGGLVHAAWPDREDVHFSALAHRMLADQLHAYLSSGVTAIP